MSNNHILLICTSAVALGLGGCTVAKEQLGLTRHSPDEFTVMERAPLAIPTDMVDLPRPQPGAPRPQEVAVSTQAKAAVLGDEAAAAAPTKTSAAEHALLQKTNAQNAPAGIRATVDAEKDEDTTNAQPVVKRLLGLGSKEKSSTVVNATEEAKRIQSQKAAGQKVTGADTPTVVQ